MRADKRRAWRRDCFCLAVNAPLTPLLPRLLHPALCWQVDSVVCWQVDSRFFISTRSNVDLGYSKIFDGKYVAFGLVLEGMEVLCSLPTFACPRVHLPCCNLFRPRMFLVGVVYGVTCHVA